MVWTKTTEALPQAADPETEQYVRCLAYYKPWGISPIVCILVWDCLEGHWVDDERREFVCSRKDVSHWMPVPKAPEPATETAGAL
jgi:hypothetical protein